MLQRRGTEFRLVRCKNCKHVYVSPRPTLDSIDWFYPADYGPHQEVLSSSIAKPVATNESNQDRPVSKWRWVKEQLGLRSVYRWLIDSASEIIPQTSLESPQALEIGCGAGRFLDLLAEKGWSAQGMEPADAPAQRCRARGLQVATGDLERVDLPEKAFDAIFAWMVVEHMHQPEVALRKISQSLCDDGSFLFSVPNFGCWEAKLFGRYWYGIQLVHLNYFTVKELDTLLAKAGMRIEKVIHQPSLRNVVGSIGIVLRERMGCESLGNWMIRYAGEMSMWSQLGVAPLARLLSFIGQSGRITVIARRAA